MVLGDVIITLLVQRSSLEEKRTLTRHMGLTKMEIDYIPNEMRLINFEPIFNDFGG